MAKSILVSNFISVSFSPPLVTESAILHDLTCVIGEAHTETSTRATCDRLTNLTFWCRGSRRCSEHVVGTASDFVHVALGSDRLLLWERTNVFGRGSSQAAVTELTGGLGAGEHLGLTFELRRRWAERYARTCTRCSCGEHLTLLHRCGRATLDSPASFLLAELKVVNHVLHAVVFAEVRLDRGTDIGGYLGQLVLEQLRAGAVVRRDERTLATFSEHLSESSRTFRSRLGRLRSLGSRLGRLRTAAKESGSATAHDAADQGSLCIRLHNAFKGLPIIVVNGCGDVSSDLLHGLLRAFLYEALRDRAASEALPDSETSTPGDDRFEVPTCGG